MLNNFFPKAPLKTFFLMHSIVNQACFNLLLLCSLYKPSNLMMLMLFLAVIITMDLNQHMLTYIRNVLDEQNRCILSDYVLLLI